MKAPITQAQAWAVITESAGWNAKELPVLPELDQEDQQWLTDNPNTGFIGAFIRGYATGHGLKCAAHARELALSEAIAICRRNAQNTSADELEALKGK